MSLFSKKLTELSRQLLSLVAGLLIGCYRLLFAPSMGGSCRFEPSCSVYSQEAFQQHSFLKAFKLTFLRLLKCRPGGNFGYDPVPQQESKNGQ